MARNTEARSDPGSRVQVRRAGSGILAKRPSSEIKRTAREEGMRFLRESALAKARAGVTTLREINKVTFIE